MTKELEATLGIMASLVSTSLEVGRLVILARDLENYLKRFCKHLFILTGDNDHPYRLLGSATALKIRDRYLLYCCGHQIDDVDPSMVCFLHAESNTTISGSRIIWPTKTAENTDVDWTDVRGIQYVPESYALANLSSHFFEIIPRRNVWPKDFREHFLIFGYPSERQRLDYQDGPSLKHIHGVQTFTTGTYDGPSNSPFVHRLKMSRTEVFNVDGMSGGPIFYLGTRGIGDYFVGFAGIIQRGGRESDYLHFLEADFFLHMFNMS